MAFTDCPTGSSVSDTNLGQECKLSLQSATIKSAQYIHALNCSIDCDCDWKVAPDKTCTSVGLIEPINPSYCGLGSDINTPNYSFLIMDVNFNPPYIYNKDGDKVDIDFVVANKYCLDTAKKLDPNNTQCDTACKKQPPLIITFPINCCVTEATLPAPAKKVQALSAEVSTCEQFTPNSPNGACTQGTCPKGSSCKTSLSGDLDKPCGCIPNSVTATFTCDGFTPNSPGGCIQGTCPEGSSCKTSLSGDLDKPCGCFLDP